MEVLNINVIIIIIIVIIIIIIIIIIISIIDCTVTKVERDLLALPVRMGSHGFTDPVVTSSSIKVTNPIWGELFSKSTSFQMP